MTTFLAAVSLFIQGALLYFVYGISQELRKLRDLQANHPQPTMRLRGDHSLIFLPTNAEKFEANSSAFSRRPETTYAIWAWRGTCWELELGTVPPGFEPVGPPQFHGAYSGQRVKKECARC